MPALPDADRKRIWRGLSRWWSNVREPFALTKADLQAAIAATDTWIDSNQASFNSALPVAARNNMTLAQKTLLFCAVALMRQGLGYLKFIFGEVD
jgi:hypothetical protein